MKIRVPTSTPATPPASEAVAGSLAPTPTNEAEIVTQAPRLVKSAEGLSRLERLLEKDFPQEKLVGYLRDLCEAEDVKMTKEGMEYRAPNWDARKNGLDRVLELLRYKRKNEPVVGDGPPVKLIFNVVNPIIEAKREEPAPEE